MQAENRLRIQDAKFVGQRGNRKLFMQNVERDLLGRFSGGTGWTVVGGGSFVAARSFLGLLANACDILGSRISKCEPLSVTILLFIAYSFVVMSLAISVVTTHARYGSFTKRYSRELLCQYTQRHDDAATIDTWVKKKCFIYKAFIYQGNSSKTSRIIIQMSLR